MPVPRPLSRRAPAWLALAALLCWPLAACAATYSENIERYSAAKTGAEQMKYLDAALEAWTYGDGLAAKRTAYHLRGNLRWLQGDGKGAVEDFTEVIRMDPDDLGIYLNRGNAYKMIKDYKSAMRDLSTAAKSPDAAARGAALCSVGDIFLFSKNYAKAAEYYEAARKLNPSDNTPVFNHSLLYYKTGKYEKAIALARKAGRMDAGGTFKFFELTITGYANFSLGRYAASLADFNSALKQKPDYIPALIGAGLAHSARSETAPANARLKEAERLHPQLKAGVKALEVYAEAGKFQFLNEKVLKEFDTMSLLLHYSK